MLKKVPHTYTIVFSIIIICAILTWIIPGRGICPGNRRCQWSGTYRNRERFIPRGCEKPANVAGVLALFNGFRNKPELSLLS